MLLGFKRVIAGVAAALLAVSSASAQDLSALFGGPPAPSGEELEELIEKAQDHPLGSQENPVRANMPPGQRAYLARLRCADGRAPSFERVGSFGFGVFGRIIDGYEVTCQSGDPEKSIVFIDMYHPDHIETDPVPGFTIVDPEPAQTKKKQPAN